MIVVFVILLMSAVSGDSIRKAKVPTNGTGIKDKSHNFNRPIIDVVKEYGHNQEDVYNKNIFKMSKELTGIDEISVNNGFLFNPDLNNYILKHSYLEVMWCFKLYKEMTFYKTFEKISAMESNNQFTIYSAISKKQWPSGRNPRHAVCDAISKQPITSGLYDNFLLPARAKYLHITTGEYEDVKKLLGIDSLATRLEFAQALKIETVEIRIKPKIITAIENKLKTMSFESISLRDDRAKGNHGNKPQQRSSMFKLISDSYHVSQHALYTCMDFYTSTPRKIAILNEASFRSLAHFTKNPKPINVTFRDIFTQVQSAMVDLKRMLNMPLLLALDKNHIQHTIVNKTLLNIMIIVAKEPADIIMSYYEMPEEIRTFIEKTRMSKFHILMSQSKMRLEHLSIDFFVSLLKKQTVESLKNSILRYDTQEINEAYIESVEKIIRKSTLIDFQRIYQKSWSVSQLKDTSLLNIASHQGLTGNEFLQVYGMESKNLSDVTSFANYTFGMLRTHEERDILSYTLKQLGELMKTEIDQVVNSQPVKSVDQQMGLSRGVIKTTTQPTTSEIDAESDNIRGGPPKLLVGIPVLICTIASITGLLAWMYRAKNIQQQSAW